MKIDKEKIAGLLKLSDAELWREIHALAKQHGYLLPENAPQKSDMQKIRALMGEAEKISTLDAIRLLAKFKAKRTKE